jgi:hypothetical protein
MSKKNERSSLQLSLNNSASQRPRLNSPATPLCLGHDMPCSAAPHRASRRLCSSFSQLSRREIPKPARFVLESPGYGSRRWTSRAQHHLRQTSVRSGALHRPAHSPSDACGASPTMARSPRPPPSLEVESPVRSLGSSWSESVRVCSL